MVIHMWLNISFAFGYSFFLANIFELYFIIVKCANIVLKLFINIFNYFLLLESEVLG